MKKTLLSILFAVTLSLFVSNYGSAAESHTKDLSIKQGEEEVRNYLKISHKNYKINSDAYISFLQGINEQSDEIEKKGFNFVLMEVYSTTYLEELEKYIQTQEKKAKSQADVSADKFKLPNDIKKETVEDIQEKNIKIDKEIEKETKKEREKVQNQKINLLSQSYPVITFATPVRSGYNRSAAKRYMVNNWKSTNSSFGYFGGGGGDCTNYASQVLLAGGMNMDTSGLIYRPGWHKNTKGWHNVSVPKSHGRRTYSTSWTVVGDFYKYWAGTKRHKVYNFTSPKAVSKYARTGDILQIYSKSSKKWYHTAIIYDIYKGYPRFSAHSKHHLYAHLEREAKPKHYKYRIIKF
ncbi:amidase domain-containing protein [Bacillus haynesii]|uniref:amidase domain-containing protein n=1 Tax=Bacillus haynesii TaxID=1925021 RepID=UPI00227F518C|nr:amidase domain-containing protein [Bacillus haynesii]MCY7911984.1 amidase domain-containing protein [Bacillus haynesii]MCY7926970.1 amidase domain-containing protein [Bacillus haynesii]MCY8006230.1 amidase domain-containing protein [Bacillus haynesii]MCY8774778.1 amidase domain-containing protein [Bacillus haynesii]MEC0789923.1 amidase domain-containing protein [Bacillus haynesii]